MPKIEVELTEHELDVLQSTFGWLLDEDHAAIPPGWLDDHTGIEGSDTAMESLATKFAKARRG